MKNEKFIDLIKNEFLTIDEEFNLYEGFDGFRNWVELNNLNLDDSLEEFYNSYYKYQRKKRGGVFVDTNKLIFNFGISYLRKLMYLELYFMKKKFGRTKLKALLTYGKKNEDKDTIIRAVKLIKPRISKIIKDNKIDAVALIPSSKNRDVQINDIVTKVCFSDFPFVELSKVKGPEAKAQKDLNTISERVNNAKMSIELVNTRIKYERVLIVDDALRTGASMNETAKKLLKTKTAKDVLGLALTGFIGKIDKNKIK